MVPFRPASSRDKGGKGPLDGGGESDHHRPSLRVPVAVLGQKGVPKECQGDKERCIKHHLWLKMKKLQHHTTQGKKMSARVPLRARKRHKSRSMVSRDRWDELRGPGTKALNAQCQQVPIAAMSSMKILNSSCRAFVLER